MKTKTGIIARMEAMQQRFGRFPSLLQSAENERQILRCAPPFDAQAEYENDLRHESRMADEAERTEAE